MVDDNKKPADKSLIERLDKLQYKRGHADAQAGHRPAVFGGTYLEGYRAGISKNKKEDSRLDHINEVRFDYDLPPITREQLDRSQSEMMDETYGYDTGK